MYVRNDISALKTYTIPTIDTFAKWVNIRHTHNKHKSNDVYLLICILAPLPPPPPSPPAPLYYLMMNTPKSKCLKYHRTRVFICIIRACQCNLVLMHLCHQYIIDGRCAEGHSIPPNYIMCFRFKDFLR